MHRSKVAVIKCDSYDEREVLKAVEAGLELLGGILTFVKSGESIVMKPNVLIGSNPDKCVTTHPSVFKVVGKLFQGAGATVCYGDSPSFGGCGFNMRRARLKQAGDELGIEMADFDKGRAVSHAGSLLIKSFVIANGVLDSDGLVSLPKLKTHPLTRFTGAVKNQFGCVPGLLKSQYHVKLPDPYDFATMLVDLNTLIRPRLCIMDGIMAMEGNGPRGGNARKLGVLLISSDPIALDATACRIIDLPPEVVTTSEPGEKAGLGTYHAENIEILGEEIETLVDREFDAIRRAPVPRSAGRLSTFIKNRICERPVIDMARCNSCGTCVRMCPVDPKAVDWYNGDESRPPVHNYSRCIRCYCCQETCPEGAITVERPLLGKIYSRF